MRLCGDGEGELVVGQAELAVLDEEQARTRAEEVRAAKLERRAKEKAAWKEVVYAPYVPPEEAAAREQQLQEEAREREEVRLMRAEEEAKEAEAKAEEERRRREEEEAQKTARGGKGKKAVAATPKAKLSREEAERAERERVEVEERHAEEERAERERVEREVTAAEEEAFAYDASEWSPVFLLQWKREVERERMEMHMEQLEEERLAQAGGKGGGGGKGGKGGGGDVEGPKKRRPPSMASVALSDDDEGLDPTILIDSCPITASPLAHSAYTHLTNALQAALAACDFPLLARTSLALVRLFTTRHPLLSSKYLALHLSATVSAYTLKLTSTINPATADGHIRRERDRLAHPHLNLRWDGEDDAVDQRGGGWCRAAAIGRVDEWLSDSSLLSPWSSHLLLQVEDEKDPVLKGWDAVYAQMLVSIPSSVSILTVLYSVDEHALYLSLLSSERFPLSSRFSRTVLTADEDDELHRLIAFFAAISGTLHTALSPTTSSTQADQLASVDAAFTSALASLNSLLTLPFTRALLHPSLLHDRDLIILPCPLLFPLPWEALPLLTSVGHRSLCRDFSFAFFHRRMETSVAEPINRAGVVWVVEGGEGEVAGEGVERAVATLKGKEVRGHSAAGHRLNPGDWVDVMDAATDGGAVVYVGTTPLLQSMTAATLNALDCRGVHLAVLMDHAVARQVEAVGTVGGMGGRGGGGGGGGAGECLSLYDALVLLSVRGVNSILTHAWSMSSLLNAAQAGLAARMLSQGQSVASVVRMLREQVEVEVEGGGGGGGGEGGEIKQPLPSPSGRRGKAGGGPMSPKKAPAMSPKGKQGGKTSGQAVASDEGGKEVLAVRGFDRYNTILVGLPHWRL